MAEITERLQKQGDAITDGYHDVLEAVQKATPEGVDIRVLACFFAVEINLIAEKYPQFHNMVEVAMDRQKH